MLMRPMPFPKSYPLPLWQSEEWARTLRSLGRDAWIEPFEGAGQALVVTRSFGPFGKLRFASRGPQWADGASQDDRIHALEAIKLNALNPNSEDRDVLEHAGYLQIVKPKQVAVLPVAENFNDQLMATQTKWRNALRQGLRKKLWTSHDRFDPKSHDWIFGEDRKQQRKKGFRSPHPILTRCFAQTNPGHVMVSQMWQGSGIIAAMVFLRHGAMATYHVGWTSAAGRAARAHHVLLTKAAQELRRSGVQFIDLGLYDAKGAPGLARFKRGSGANVHTLGGTWLHHPLRWKSKTS